MTKLKRFKLKLIVQTSLNDIGHKVLKQNTIFNTRDMKIFTAYQTGSVTELVRTWIILLLLQITCQGAMKHILPSRAKTREGEFRKGNAVTR